MENERHAHPPKNGIQPSKSFFSAHMPHRRKTVKNKDVDPQVDVVYSSQTITSLNSISPQNTSSGSIDKTSTPNMTSISPVSSSSASSSHSSLTSIKRPTSNQTGPFRLSHHATFPSFTSKNQSPHSTSSPSLPNDLRQSESHSRVHSVASYLSFSSHKKHHAASRAPSPAPSINDKISRQSLQTSEMSVKTMPDSTVFWPEDQHHRHGKFFNKLHATKRKLQSSPSLRKANKTVAHDSALAPKSLKPRLSFKPEPKCKYTLFLDHFFFILTMSTDVDEFRQSVLHAMKESTGSLVTTSLKYSVDDGNWVT